MKKRRGYFADQGHINKIGSGRSILYFSALFLSPCGILAPLFTGESPLVAALIIATFSWWFLFGVYGLAVKRDLFTDIAPFVALPFAVIGFVLFGMKKLAGGGRWVLTLVGALAPLSGDEAAATPRDWSTAVTNSRVQKRLANKFTAVFGWNDRRVVYADFKEDLHYLITGVTGAGKTTIAYTLILSLISSMSSFSKWEFVLHDPEGLMVKYRLLEKAFPNKFKIFVKFEDIYDSMVKLIEEMEERTREIGESDSVSFEIDNLPIPQRLIVIDEPLMIFPRKSGKGEDKRTGREYEQMLMQLVTVGRQAGYHVVLLTTYARGDVISTTYRHNFVPISGWLPKSANRALGSRGAEQLQKYQFIYQEDPMHPWVKFTTYDVQPTHIRTAIASLFEEPESAGEIATSIFARLGGCGRRVILSDGLPFCELLVQKGVLDSVPFPWSECRFVGGELKESKAAQRWAIRFLEDLEKAGIAGPPRTGKNREFLMTDIESAVVSWKKFDDGRIRE
jgi:hypothetical protein